MQRPESFGHHGAYRVVSELGRGGFATVYKAYDERLDRYVAIKVLHAAVVQDERDIQRFQREARAAARLSAHPNIITIHDYGEQGGLAYLVLEYIEGGTLEDHVTERLSMADIGRIIGEIGAALDYAHSQHVIHRDIKPANVLLRRDGRVVLTDFGIARLLDDPGMSRAGFAGTAEYMAPEQFTDSPIDHRCDIYALGVVAYRLLAGTPPFQGKTWLTLAQKHINEPPPPLSAPGRMVPPAAEVVVHRAMAKDPADRPSTAGEFATELAAALRPAALLEEAQAALRHGELDRAERFAAEILVNDPDAAGAQYVRQEAVRRRQLGPEPDKVTEVLDLGTLQAAVERERERHSQVTGQPVSEPPRPAEEQRLRREREAQERAEHERLERERAEQERVEREHLERERLERQRIEQERQERERVERARVERERAEQERVERERLERERAEQERVERERLERERAERERTALLRAEREAAEQEAADRAERTRLEREAREKEAAAKAAPEPWAGVSHPPVPPPAGVPRPGSVIPGPTHGDPAETPIVPLRAPLMAPPSEHPAERASSESASPGARGRLPLIVAALAILLGGGALVTWLMRSDDTPVPAPTPTTVAAASTTAPTLAPPVVSTSAPTAAPTTAPTTAAAAPTTAPTAVPTVVPTAQPTLAPTAAPTAPPAVAPTAVAIAPPGAAPGPPLPASRAGHSATLLENGGLLFVGGREGDSTRAEAAWYHPASARWFAAGSMASPRARHTTTLLANGTVLVVGGRSSNTVLPDAAELYDPATNGWSAAGKLTTPRAGHTATLLKDGRVLVIGGYDPSAFPLNTAEIYDPASNTWAATAKMAGAHSGHTATLLPNGQVLVVGGFGTQSQATTERFDPATNTWTSAAPSSAGRYDHTATVLPDGRVFVAGGLNSGQGGTYLASAEVYDPASDRWAPAGTMAGPRSGHTATLLSDGRVLVAGGSSGSQAGVQLASAEMYDPAANAWRSAGTLAGPRSGHTATLLPDGRVLVAGGGSGDSAPGIEQYDPPANSWTAGQ